MKFVRTPFPFSVAGLATGSRQTLLAQSCSGHYSIDSHGSYRFTVKTPGVHVYNMPLCAPQPTNCPASVLTVTAWQTITTGNASVTNPYIGATKTNTATIKRDQLSVRAKAAAGLSVQLPDVNKKLFEHSVKPALARKSGIGLKRPCNRPVATHLLNTSVGDVNCARDRIVSGTSLLVRTFTSYSAPMLEQVNVQQPTKTHSLSCITVTQKHFKQPCAFFL